ncbi:C39 family peptidase [Tuberibacillus sp. Marseille-P3662]|uniref:C39 family peptidase n=1 Tax=Tuberibacillus sp. Marseille-P3662 TaxID=1965358 RepID=UPI0015940F10|nr:C39 family peptidase [Tuberibacillus sp. Marseille-P3662]
MKKTILWSVSILFLIGLGLVGFSQINGLEYTGQNAMTTMALGQKRSSVDAYSITTDATRAKAAELQTNNDESSGQENQEGSKDQPQPKGLSELKKKQSSSQNKSQQASQPIDVPLISQKPQLPKGCEVTSLAMLIASADVEVSKMTLANKIPKVPWTKNGLHGNPNNGFVGNMYTWDQPGLGVFHGPVADLAREYLGERVIDLTGSKWGIIEKQLEKGHPVWVIVTSRYRHMPSSFWRNWKTKDGTIKVSYKEHSVVLTGSDDNYIYFNDPLANQKNRKISKQSFIDGWTQFGRQAISYN